MDKAASINARIEPKLKARAESIFHHLGLSSAEAIRLFYRQVCLKRGLPFSVKLPNKETLAAIQELESGKGTRYDSMEVVWDDLKDA